MSFPKLVKDEDSFVSAKQVNEFMKDDVEVFMILVSMKDESIYSIGELPVLWDFPKVFPDDISDLPLEREVEFTTDSVHGISHVLMNLYRMPTLELNKLNKKLEEFLGKKFVRSSVSP